MNDNLPTSSAFPEPFRAAYYVATDEIGYEPSDGTTALHRINRPCGRHPGIVARILDGSRKRGGQAVQIQTPDLIRIN